MVLFVLVQKRAPDSLELELQVDMSHPTWMLGTEFGPSERVALVH